MSGRRAKKVRSAERARPTYLKNAETVRRTAEAVLSVDLSSFRLGNRVPQVVVGLCRAAFAQSRTVAVLTANGMSASAAPNRRLFLEAALRLHWLRDLSCDDRRRAVDTMLAKDRKDTNRTLAYLAKVGQQAEFDPTEMNEFILDPAETGAIQEQARKLDAAVKSTDVEAWSIYAMWREETKHAHPSATLAGAYAPTFDDAHLSSGEPDPTDLNLEAHSLVQQLIVTTTESLRDDEQVPHEVAGRITAAYLASSPLQV
jgi:hypothetical protein